jgi:pilus assembly protein CpaE
MRQVVRVIIFTEDEEFAPTLRREWLSVESVRVVAELNEPSMLESAVQQFHPDALALHLDPTPDQIMPHAERLVASHPDLPVVAISGSTDGQLILAAMRAGFREFLTLPLGDEAIAEAVCKIAATRQVHARQGQIWAVVGSVGGVGGTTVAVNLAAELAGMNVGKVALVDLDFRFGHVTTFLDLQPQFTIADLCDTHAQLDPQMVAKAMLRHSSGVHVLSRPQHLEQADQLTGAHCVAVLSALQELYDYVILDGPNRYDPAGQAVLDTADLLLLVMQLQVPSVRNADRLLHGLLQHGFNADRVHLLCNRGDRENSNLERGHVESTLNCKIFSVLPDEWAAVSNAINMGEPLAGSAPRSRVRQAILELAGRLVRPDGESPANGRNKRGGLLSKLFNEG